MDDDLRTFSHQHVLRQLETAELKNGYYTLEFYALPNGKPSTTATGKIGRFYLYPSGGTLRDADFHLIFYDSRYDTYRGFKPPRRQGPAPPRSGNI